MKNICLIGALVLFAGCITPPPERADCWTIEWTSPIDDTIFAKDLAHLPVARLAQATVRAPFNGTRLAVLRPDGSIAFDSFNEFAASPASLLRGAAEDALEASDHFSEVVSPSSFVTTDYSVELTVTRLALDCRREGQRTAVVSLFLTLVRERSVLATIRAEASVPADDGDFTRAFSQAFTKAINSAISRLPTKK